MNEHYDLSEELLGIASAPAVDATGSKGMAPSDLWCRDMRVACIQENTLHLKHKTRQSYTCMLNSEYVLNKKPFIVLVIWPHFAPDTQAHHFICKLSLKEIQMYCDIRVVRNRQCCLWDSWV